MMLILANIKIMLEILSLSLANAHTILKDNLSAERDTMVKYKFNIESDKNWQNWSNAQRGRLGSTKCHTSHRFQCFDIASNSKTDIYNARITTTEAHSFFYADECVKKMFNAGEFIKVSIAFLAILVVSLF